MEISIANTIVANIKADCDINKENKENLPVPSPQIQETIMIEPLKLNENKKKITDLTTPKKKTQIVLPQKLLLINDKSSSANKGIGVKETKTTGAIQEKDPQKILSKSISHSSNNIMSSGGHQNETLKNDNFPNRLLEKNDKLKRGGGGTSPAESRGKQSGGNTKTMLENKKNNKNFCDLDVISNQNHNHLQLQKKSLNTTNISTSVPNQFSSFFNQKEHPFYQNVSKSRYCWIPNTGGFNNNMMQNSLYHSSSYTTHNTMNNTINMNMLIKPGILNITNIPNNVMFDHPSYPYGYGKPFNPPAHLPFPTIPTPISFATARPCLPILNQQQFYFIPPHNGNSTVQNSPPGHPNTYCIKNQGLVVQQPSYKTNLNHLTDLNFKGNIRSTTDISNNKMIIPPPKIHNNMPFQSFTNDLTTKSCLFDINRYLYCNNDKSNYGLNGNHCFKPIPQAPLLLEKYNIHGSRQNVEPVIDYNNNNYVDAKEAFVKKNTRGLNSSNNNNFNNLFYETLNSGSTCNFNCPVGTNKNAAHRDISSQFNVSGKGRRRFSTNMMDNNNNRNNWRCETSPINNNNNTNQLTNDDFKIFVNTRGEYFKLMNVKGTSYVIPYDPWNNNLSKPTQTSIDIATNGSQNFLPLMETYNLSGNFGLPTLKNDIRREQSAYSNKPSGYNIVKEKSESGFVKSIGNSNNTIFSLPKVHGIVTANPLQNKTDETKEFFNISLNQTMKNAPMAETNRFSQISHDNMKQSKGIDILSLMVKDEAPGKVLDDYFRDLDLDKELDLMLETFPLPKTVVEPHCCTLM